MGLYVGFTPEDLGFQLTLAQMVFGEEIVVDVDYQEACEYFVEKFMEVALDLVPVRTGFLKSTLDARTDGYLCEAEATAEYAQYVEYGTWYMDAQPYFEPAVEEGLKAFFLKGQEAMDIAREELEELCQNAMEAFVETVSDGSFLGDIGATLLGGLLLWLTFPIMVNVYGIIRTLTDPFQDDSKAHQISYMDKFDIEIEIT